MCIPMLAPIGMALGASAGSAATIGTLVTAGAGMSALGAYQGAQSQKAMANYNAQVAQNNAQVAEWQAQDAQRRGEEEAQAVRRQGDQIRGSQRATMAARGLDLAEGTSAELIAQTDFFSLADQTTARNNAAREAWGRRVQGSNFRAEAGMQRATARSIKPGMAAASSLLGSAAAVAPRWKS